MDQSELFVEREAAVKLLAGVAADWLSDKRREVLGYIVSPTLDTRTGSCVIAVRDLQLREAHLQMNAVNPFLDNPQSKHDLWCVMANRAIAILRELLA